VSARTLVVGCLVAASTVSFSGVALARRPPALERFQEQSARALAACPEAPARSTDGYRDMLARVRPDFWGPELLPPTLQLVAQPAVYHVQPGHLVLVCDGARIHTSTGYRGMFDRVSPKRAGRVVARIP
jgi:hypothetical protein